MGASEFVILAKYLYEDKFQADGMAGHVARKGKDEIAYEFFL
jgi:hypothetical protein